MTLSADVAIRPAVPGDAAEIARLAGEWGYPTTAAVVEHNLAPILANPSHHVVVIARDERLLAWAHVERRLSLDRDERAEIVGLIVDETARRSGFGRALVGVAESWALARGLTAVAVRSNVARETSHPFYEALGYSRSKTQHVYVKPLVPARR